MNKKVSKSGKLLLLNTINAVNLQNHLSEESDMWKKHQKLKKKSRSESKRKRHKREDEDNGDDVKSEVKRNRLKRIAQKYETNLERWGHDGYHELYPDECSSKSSNSSLSTTTYSHSSESESDSSNGRERRRKRKHKKTKKQKKKEKRRKEKKKKSSKKD